MNINLHKYRWINRKNGNRYIDKYSKIQAMTEKDAPPPGSARARRPEEARATGGRPALAPPSQPGSPISRS